MTKDIKTERRWLRSVIAASAEPLPNFPWMRGQRRKPTAVQPPSSETTHQRPTLFRTPGAIAAR